jgi:hemerythrin-like domain-containing protein
VHHPREDAAFACLARRFPDLELPLARLQQEHRVIAHAGEAPASADRRDRRRRRTFRAPRVEAAAATYLVYYRSHIEHEEREVLGRAEAALSSEDWEAVRNAAPHAEAPALRPRRPTSAFASCGARISLES